MGTIKISMFEKHMKKYSTKRLQSMTTDSDYAVNAKKAAKKLLMKR